MKTCKNPLNLTDTLITFGKFKDAHRDAHDWPECRAIANLGQRMVREIQHLHKVLIEVRKMLPATYHDYFDPMRLDKLLARTEVHDYGDNQKVT
jgi:hypothetical protein